MPSPSPLPLQPEGAARTDAYRADYRANKIPARYRGLPHLALTTAITIGGALFAVGQLDAPTFAQVSMVPAFFFIANVAEYLGHRYPMHHKYRGLESVFLRHSATHHRFFLSEDMYGHDARDWHVTLFAPVLLLFFFGGIGAPLAGLLFWLVSPNVGWLFVATVLLYFVVYEWLHLSYHAPERSILHRLPLLRLLSAHHRTHHDPRRMTKYNFNISFPIVDILVGTRAK